MNVKSKSNCIRGIFGCSQMYWEHPKKNKIKNKL